AAAGSAFSTTTRRSMTWPTPPVLRRRNSCCGWVRPAGAPTPRSGAAPWRDAAPHRPPEQPPPPSICTGIDDMTGRRQAFSTDEFAARLARVREQMQGLGIDVLLVNTPE